MKLLLLLILLANSSLLCAQTSEDHLLRFVRGTVLEGHSGNIYKLAFLDGSQHRLVSIGYNDKAVNLWQPVSGELLRSVDLSFKPYDFVVANGNAYLDIVLITGSVKRVEIEGDGLGVPRSHWGESVGGYGRIAQNRTGNFYAIASRGSDVVVWNAVTKKQHQSYLGTADYRAVSFLNSDSTFVAVDSQNGFSIWDVMANEGFGAKESFTIPGEKSGLTAEAIDFNAATSLLAITHLDGRVTLWTVGPGLSAKHLRTMRLPQSAFTPMFSPQGQLLFVSCQDGNVYVFETGSGKLVKGWLGDAAGIYSLAMNDRGDLMAGGTLDGKIVVWWVPQ